MATQGQNTDEEHDPRTLHSPFLLRLFFKVDEFHSVNEFTPGSLPRSQLHIYTWHNCSLRELTHLVTTTLPQLLPDPASGTRVAYRHIYPDLQRRYPPGSIGRFDVKDIGSVVLSRADRGPDVNGEVTANGGHGMHDDDTDDRPHANGDSALTSDPSALWKSLTGDTAKTLGDIKFVQGDYIACAIIPPLSNGSVAPVPAPPSPPLSRGAPSEPLPPGSASSYSSRNSAYPNDRPREDGYSFGGRRGGRPGSFASDDRRGVPPGEWRRGERLPDGPANGRGYYGRSRGRGPRMDDHWGRRPPPRY